MKYFSLILILLIFICSPVLAGDDEEEFFREPIAILWGFAGEGSRSYVLEVRHSFESGVLLPDVFGQIGLIPDVVVGDVIYESNPDGEAKDAIWAKVTAHYDNLFGYEWLEGRASYSDELLGSYLGAGLGLSPIDNSWFGGYYLGSEGYKLYGEVAYPITDKWWGYGVLEYYTESEWVEGMAGLRFDGYIYIAAQNREDTWIYMLGISQEL